MSDIVLEMSNVSKKFQRGEIHNSLRDLIPALTGKFLTGFRSNSLDKNEFWALNDVSFRVSKGEALGIIGSNGAGKSTILKLLSGVMKPTMGNISVHGRLSSLIELGAGFHQDLTGRENIFLNGAILGMPIKQIKNKFDAIVEFAGLTDFIDTPVKRYSSGMYARLGFSVAVHVEPDILIVDEVLSVGDYAFQKKCLERMRSVLSGGSTVIFVSHNLRAVAEMCQRCLLLERGKVLMEGPAPQVVKEYLKRSKDNNQEDSRKEAHILRAEFRDQNGETLQFESGQKAYFEVTIAGNNDIDMLSLSLTMVDDDSYRIFDTSTERLNGTSFSLRKGENKKIIFELSLHLAPGTYHVGTYVYRYDIEKLYDARVPAATIYVKSTKDIGGAVNLYPSVSITES